MGRIRKLALKFIADGVWDMLLFPPWFSLFFFFFSFFYISFIQFYLHCLYKFGLRHAAFLRRELFPSFNREFFIYIWNALSLPFRSDESILSLFLKCLDKKKKKTPATAHHTLCKYTSVSAVNVNVPFTSRKHQTVQNYPASSFAEHLSYVLPPENPVFESLYILFSWETLQNHYK